MTNPIGDTPRARMVASRIFIFTGGKGMYYFCVEKLIYSIKRDLIERTKRT